MTTKVIEYKSSQITVISDTVAVLETGANDGVIHTWSGYVDDNRQAAVTWDFDWEDLKIQGFDRLVGHLIVNSVNENHSHKSSLISKPCSKLKKKLLPIGLEPATHNAGLSYFLLAPLVQNDDRRMRAATTTPNSPLEKNLYALLPSSSVALMAQLCACAAVVREVPGSVLAAVKHSFKNTKPDSVTSGRTDASSVLYIRKMFAASDKTDMVLVVEGKKLNVNRSFLSFHSDYFSTLFSANFKEGQMEEIEIKEVSYEDSGLLLSAIYPMQVFPNDSTVEKLLELADRFLMPSVKHIVEHYLLNQSKLENEKMMMLGDRYGIKSVLERAISQTNTVEKMKKLNMSPEYAKLSMETVARLFERFVQIS
ncbi:unnamed protein product [Caenorhabditis nigoni]